MRTYYRGPDAAVTDELFIWQSGATRAFVLEELRDVGRVQQESSRLSRVIAGVLLAVAGAVWVQLELPARWYVGVGALVAALAIIGWPSHSRRWTLKAAYRGEEDVTLYSSADPRVFNQVARALGRAIEDSR
ncbi:DUF6232 family protein [Actinoplanes friuliensis]|uniref:Uncharacterized protein n=1 Tax=Actinoplanes friuliensis DSM 7358 TaxID=1246995 RepID=U5VZP3_9ACTN|nr:DUF6232 family protein [Actinoplanes friuliensis]AGZ42463.1 hypothetical protein AFR_20955 [Actinoplanes friuliensis DSM 7358]